MDRRHLVAAAALGTGVAIFLLAGSPDPEREPEAIVEASPTEPDQAASDEPAARPGLVLPQPKVKTTRTGPAGEGPNKGAEGAELVEVGEALQTEDTAPPPTERLRADWEPVAPADVHEVVPEVVREMIPGIKGCYEDWLSVDPTLSGRIEMEFSVGEEGLGEVFVYDHTDMPVGLQSCFGAAIYEADWPPFEESTDIVYPFILTTDGPP